MLDPKQVKGSLYDPSFEQDSCGVGFVARPSASPSRDIVEMALEAVANLTHRGAVDADAKTGDGAGILVQIPRRFLQREARKLGLRLTTADALAVGMVFLPRKVRRAARARRILEAAAQRRGLRVLGWRQVPLDRSALGDKALATCPNVAQLLSDAALRPPGRRLRTRAVPGAQGSRNRPPRRGHRRLLRRLALPSHRWSTRDCWWPRSSAASTPTSRTQSSNRPSPSSISATAPTPSPPGRWPSPSACWPTTARSTPSRATSTGRRAREAGLSSPVWGDDVEALKPVIVPGGSDSAMLDNVLESARPLRPRRPARHADARPRGVGAARPTSTRPGATSTSTTPASWSRGTAPPPSPSATAPRSAPPSTATACARCATRSPTTGWWWPRSEVGVVDMPDARVVEKGRLAPGEMLVVDTARGRILKKPEVMAEVVGRRPYGQWVRRNLHDLSPAHLEPRACQRPPPRTSARGLCPSFRPPSPAPTKTSR